MIPDIRNRYNTQFSQDKYRAFLDDIALQFNHVPGFRVAESPIFVPNALKEKLFTACHQIADCILRPDFGALTEGTMTPGTKVPGENEHTKFLQMDFGLCDDGQGNIEPKLIEVQGFPSLYFYQDFIARMYRKHFDIPSNLNHLFNGYDADSYMKLLGEIIVGPEDPNEVVLIDVEPYKQATQIDFHAAHKALGLRIACVQDIFKQGNKLYYKNEKGQTVHVKRLFNRVIFDELMSRNDLELRFKFTDELDVHWVGHPNWFFRISKYMMPFIECDYMPKTMFLDQLDNIPEDLENYVLKPLYSFSGTGVVFHVKPEDIENVKDRSQYILQEKVRYVPVIRTDEGDAVKVEVRIMMVWPEGEPRPMLVNNLARLSRGEMIGVKFNKDKTWVGGSVGFYENE
jgi:hypothetical protein